MTSAAQASTIDETADTRPGRPISTAIGNKKLFRIAFFLALMATTGAWITLLPWISKGIVSSVG